MESLGRPLRAIHVLEMIGYRASAAEAAALPRLPLPIAPASFATPDFLGFLGNGGSNALVDLALRSAAAPDLRVVTAMPWGPIHRLLTDLGRSDHLPFWKGKLPALLWTDTGNFRNPEVSPPIRHCRHARLRISAKRHRPSRGGGASIDLWRTKVVTDSARSPNIGPCT